MVKTAWRFGIEIECLVEVDLEKCLTVTEIGELKQVEFSGPDSPNETSTTIEERHIIRDRIYKKIYDHIATRLNKVLVHTAPSESIRVFCGDDSSTHSYATWMLEFDGSIQRDEGAGVSQGE
jgi:hypothetical protein